MAIELETEEVTLDALRDVRPKYRILQDLIRQGISDGTLTHGGDKLPSEHDMARSFGVAYMTVRAAVNEMVAEGALQRIHGKGTFVLHNGASAPAAAGVFALVAPSLSALWNVAGLYYFPGIVQGFCAEATRLGYEPAVIGRAKDALDSATGALAGAACLQIARGDAEALEALRDRHIPAVGVNDYRGRRSISYVAADQAGGMAEAARLLAEHGHRRVAFLPGPEGNLGAEERERGFLRAAHVFGMDVAVVDGEPSDYTDVSGLVRARALLARPKRPTAIVTAGDLIAAGVLQAAREAGLTVPGDVSVIGCGDFEIATYLQPALTTVRLPLQELGARAAQQLHVQVQGNGRRRVESVPTALIERDSVGPAPAD